MSHPRLPVAPPPADFEPDLGPDEELNDKMRTVMPWVISFAIHAGVILVACTLFFTIKTLIKDHPVVPAVTPESLTGPSDWDPTPGSTGPTDNTTLQNDDTALGLLQELQPRPTAIPTPNMSVLPILAIGRTSTGGMPGSGLVTGKPNGRNLFPGGNGKGHGIGPGDGNGPCGAARLAYVIDASGSLTDTLPFVKDALLHTVNDNLRSHVENRGHYFNVFFFSGVDTNRSIGMDRNPGLSGIFTKLEQATEARKTQAMAQISQAQAGGSGDPMQAIRKALEEGATEVHLLSDNITGRGQWELSQDKFIAEVKKAVADTVTRRPFMPDGKTRQGVSFVCYQFLYEDPLTSVGKEATLKRLVRETGGDPENDFTFVTAHSLGLR